MVHFGNKPVSFRGQQVFFQNFKLSLPPFCLILNFNYIFILKQGRYLSVQTVGGLKKERGAAGTSISPSYILSINGQGIGEMEDALIAVNADNRFVISSMFLVV